MSKSTKSGVVRGLSTTFVVGDQLKPIGKYFGRVGEQAENFYEIVQSDLRFSDAHAKTIVRNRPRCYHPELIKILGSHV